MKPVYFISRPKHSLLQLVLMELAQLPEQPQIPRMVYLMKSELALRHFLNRDSTVKLTRYDDRKVAYEVERQLMSACTPPEYETGELAHMDSLVCEFSKLRSCTQLHNYKKNLDKTSSLLILNNDKSYVDSLRTLVWKDEVSRPDLYQCMGSFNTWSMGVYHSGVMGTGQLKIARIPRSREEYDYDLSAGFEQVPLLSAINDTKNLNPIYMKYTDFLVEQFESMIVKTTVGSVSSLYGCSNGDLLKLKNVESIMSLIIHDCLRVISTLEPTLDMAMLHKDRLIDVCIKTIKQTERTSTILQRQIQKWNAAEIYNTTGYFSYMSRKNGVYCPQISLVSRILEDKISLAHLKNGEVSLD